ncbi:hypothetical protein AN476_17550 [Phaeobacter sp. 11ANDIMAR09]|nr:hypothetical protein AN476_17550 [Phaeobacter sp. 11ANDIMAR09]
MCENSAKWQKDGCNLDVVVKAVARLDCGEGLEGAHRRRRIFTLRALTVLKPPQILRAGRRTAAEIAAIRSRCSEELDQTLLPLNSVGAIATRTKPI